MRIFDERKKALLSGFIYITIKSMVFRFSAKIPEFHFWGIKLLRTKELLSI